MKKLTSQEAKMINAGRTWRCKCGYKTKSGFKFAWHCSTALKFWKHYAV